MKIEEIKDKVREMLAKKYSQNVKLKPVTSEEVETHGFMRQQDAIAISNACMNKHYFVSFRAAGQSTIARIKEGKPCKGHNILDKSIKLIDGNGRWSYNITPEIGEKFAGCIGVKKDNSSELSGIYVYSKSSDALFKKVALENCTDEVLKRAYTGDYDIHDLSKLSHDKYSRLIATTPDEQTALDILNSSMLQKDEVRKGKVDRTKDKESRYTCSPYSLIRHGAQTSFFDFLLSNVGKPELKKELNKLEDTENDVIVYGKSVLKLDSDVVAFISNEIYILKSIKELYHFYKQHNLLHTIPFYYFFNELSADVRFKDDIKEYSKYINEILDTLYGKRQFAN